MSTNPPNALVPAGRKSPPAVRNESAPGGYRLASEDIRLASREEVKERLPDILGKALALIWIDREFHDMFARDPQGTLAAQGIHLPDNMIIEFQKPNSDRPRIVVYETRPNSKFKLRVFYLQLVMMAGR
ncbi:hypothetical protein N9W44_00020 [Alphaproteobacteria bacterium]|jgi:hypothetical protein|nr:hypothetical protein [Alphaproteobacteria bacterium]